MAYNQRPSYRPDRDAIPPRPVATTRSSGTMWISVGLSWVIIVASLIGTLLIFGASGKGPFATATSPVVSTTSNLTATPTPVVPTPPSGFVTEEANNGAFTYAIPSDWLVATQSLPTATLTRIYSTNPNGTSSTNANDTGDTVDVYAATTLFPASTCTTLLQGAFGTATATIAATSQSATIGTLPATSMTATATIAKVGYSATCYQSMNQRYAIVISAPTRQFAGDATNYLLKIVASFQPLIP